MVNDQHPIEDFFGLKQDSPHGEPKRALKDGIRKPSWWSQLRLLPKILSVRERYLIFLFLLVIIGSIITIPFTIYHHYTTAAAAYGGSVSEGIVGQPRFINPLLSQSSDADRDLVSLIYSGLLKYNADGQLVPDLAKSYDISSDGLNYTIYLKENLYWQDGKALNADDILYTIQTAQNSDYASPQRINWQGVSIQKVNDTTIIFTLKTKYAQFLNNLTISILPQHIWQNIKPINFSSSDYNLKPIGSGPYMFKSIQKDSVGQIRTYELTSNKTYYDGRPYIDTINLKFYDSEDQMIAGYNNNEIEDLSYVSANNLNKLKYQSRLTIQDIKLPRYFGVFFNQSQNNLLADKNIRLALNYATDRQAIIDSVAAGDGSVIYSPLIEDVLPVGNDITKYEYNPDQAKSILTAAGWTTADAKGILQKKPASAKATPPRLTVRITTSTFPELAAIANLLKEQWAKVGVEVTVDVLSAPQLQVAIKDRGYEALLFGEILNLDPDPFSLWHSSQIKDPGLNLALYQNTTADSLLEDARQTLNPTDRLKKYNDFQKLLISDAPAVFLYNPSYLYPQSTNIHGFQAKIISTPSDRFDDVEHWYVATKRVGK